MTTLFELPPLVVKPIKQNIPDVGQDLDSHTRVLRALKEAVELGQRLTPEILRSFITVQDLVNLNILSLEGLMLTTRQVRKIVPTPINNFGTSTSIAPFSVHKTLDNRVFIDGELNFVNFGSVSSVVAFNLPIGYRPVADFTTKYIGSSSQLFNCTVGANGDVTLAVDSLAFTSTNRFTGINFAAV